MIPREVVLSPGFKILFPVIDLVDLSISIMLADDIEAKCDKPFGIQLLLVARRHSEQHGKALARH